MTPPPTPPPGEIFDRAERTVDSVRRALGLTLDYTPETLPLVDHYLTQVPRDRPEVIALVAETAGAYFGEVVRKALGGTWSETPEGWLVRLDAGVTFMPSGMVAEAVAQTTLEADGEFAVPDEDRDAVEDALRDAPQVTEAEYYSLCGRLEALMLVCDVIAGRREPKD